MRIDVDIQDFPIEDRMEEAMDLLEWEKDFRDRVCEEIFLGRKDSVYHFLQGINLNNIDNCSKMKDFVESQNWIP